MAHRDHGRSRSKGRADDRELVEATPPGMADFAAMLRSVFISEGIAKKEDLVALSGRLDCQEAEQQQQSLRIAKMEKALAAMAEELQLDRKQRSAESVAQAS